MVVRCIECNTDFLGLPVICSFCPRTSLCVWCKKKLSNHVFCSDGCFMEWDAQKANWKSDSESSEEDTKSQAVDTAVSDAGAASHSAASDA
jgi:hypothetical protein